MSKPITPDEVGLYKEKVFPKEVFDVFNDFISASYCNGRATVDVDKVVPEICERLNIDKDEVFNKEYLNIEDTYRAYGWRVEYRQPGWNESYKAYYIFKKD